MHKLSPEHLRLADAIYAMRYGKGTLAGAMGAWVYCDHIHPPAESFWENWHIACRYIEDTKGVVV